MRVFPAAAAAILLAGCLASESADRWRYERILWEPDPSVESAADAKKMFDELSVKPRLTIEECYRLAIHRTETLALEGEELVRIQTQYEQAVAGWLPRVTFKGSYFQQEKVSNPSVPSSFVLPKRTQYNFYAKQPIFSGLKELYAIRQGEALYRAKEYDLRNVRLLLFVDVAEAFYSVLQLKSQLTTTEGSLKLAQERLEELAERQKVGIARRSEVLAQEAEVASTQALVEQLKGSVAVAWEALRFATGIRLPVELDDTLPTPGPLSPVEDYLQKALETRNDIRSIREQIRASEEGIGLARAGWFPTLNLEANYYTHRAGSSAGIDWDVTLSGELPLFDGFSTQAKIREAKSGLRSSQLLLEALLRQIQLEIRRAQADVVSLQNELAALEKAVSSATENYELVRAEYTQGIVTNIEVVTSLTTLQNARFDRDRASYQLKLAKIRLDIQSGSLPGESE